MNTPKGLTPFENQPWLTCQVEHFFQAGGTHVLIVLGAHQDLYKKAFPWLNAKEKHWFDLSNNKAAYVINPNPDLGQFSSIQKGLQFLSQQNFPGCYVQPIDVPVPEQLILDLLREARTGPIQAAVPTYLGKGGHPALLAKSFIEQLIDLPAQGQNSRLDRQIALLPHDRLIKIPVKENEVCLNLNTPGEFQQYCEQKE